jgi:hypothetical protein
MRGTARFAGVVLTVGCAFGAVVRSQERGRTDTPNLAAAGQVVAVRAARLFDANTGAMTAGQTVLIRGDRIAEVGRAVQVPPGARVIDLGAATLLPGMIDGHVTPTDRRRMSRSSIERSCRSRARSAIRTPASPPSPIRTRARVRTVELRNAIATGLVRARRSRTVANPRREGHGHHRARLLQRVHGRKNVNGPGCGGSGARAEAARTGAKIYTTDSWVGPDEFRPDYRSSHPPR